MQQKNMHIRISLKDIRTARELQEKTDRHTLLENYKKYRQTARGLQEKTDRQAQLETIVQEKTYRQQESYKTRQTDKHCQRTIKKTDRRQESYKKRQKDRKECTYGRSDGQTDKVVTWWVQGTWEEVVQGPGGKESAYFPGLLRNGGLALKTQGTVLQDERDTLI